jgi:mannosyltransferase
MMVTTRISTPKRGMPPSARRRPVLAVESHPAAVVGVLTLVAAVLCVLKIGSESLWLDEAYSVAVAKLPWSAFVHLVRVREANMVPFYLLLRGWISVSDSEAWVRLLAAIPAVASVPVSFVLARRLLGGVWSAGLAAGLLAINAFFVEFAQEARGYSLVMFASLVATYLFVRWIQERSDLVLASYVVVATFAVYVHLFAAFVLLAHLASLAALPRDQRPGPRRLAATYGVVTVLILPLAALVASSSNRLAWVPAPTVLTVAKAVAKLAGGRTAIVGALLVLAYGVAWVLLIVDTALVARPDGRSRRLWRRAVIIAWVATPIVGGLVLSLAKPIFQDRYLIVSLPGLAIGAAAGARAIRSAQLALLALGVAVVLCLSQVVVLDTTRDKEDWRGAAAYVEANATPQDGLVFYRPFGRVPWAYYVGSEASWPRPVVPLFDWRTQDLSNPRTVSPSVIADNSAGFERVWVVFSHAPAADESAIRLALSERFELVSTRELTGLTVQLYRRIGS